jgi:hypothetical protein
MDRREIILCLLLVAGVFTVPAFGWADINVANPLKVDIDGGGVVTPTPGWISWLFPEDSGPKPLSWFVPPDGPMLEYQYVDTVGGGGGSRNRSSGLVFVGGTGYIGPGAGGLGRNYNRLTISNLVPNKEHTFFIWSFERTGVWVVNTSNPNSKFGVWSTLNPNDWCRDNGYAGFVPGEPNGYGPKIGAYPITDTNMPAEMQTAAWGNGNGGRVFMQSPAAGDDWYLGDEHYVRFKATSDASGAITLYGWLDATDWTGNMAMPLNGFMIIPEPATAALLGLGGLALLRRKRA